MGRQREGGGNLASLCNVARTGQQGYVDVFENLTGSDAENAVGGFDEIVALAAGVQAAERIGEVEAGGKLLGFDQEAGAIGNPWVGCFHSCRPVFIDDGG